MCGVGDINGDGYADVLLGEPYADLNGLGNSTGVLSVVSFHSFIRPSTYSVSVATGALLGIQLDFPIAAAAEEYKVLLSATGSGPFHYGVDIPLSLDAWVIQSFYGIYPTPFSSGMHGILDPSGDALADMGVLPNYSSSYIGRTIWLAAIANQPGQLPGYSSVGIPITFVP